MQFNFDLFSKIAARAYKEGNPYSLEDCLGVFRIYFQEYEKHMGHPHPPIRAAQIARIMRIMPWICEDDRGAVASDIEPGWYSDLITLHFKTKYRRCDFNVNHFFSGRVREMRAYESAAGYE